MNGFAFGRWVYPIIFIMGLIFCTASHAAGVVNRAVINGAATFYSMPLAFEQLLPSTGGARFWSHANGSPVYFYGDRVVFVLSGTQSSNAGQQATIGMRFVGRALNPQLSAGDRLPGRVNYYTGSRSEWRTDVAQYSSVKYTALYPDIDLQFRGTPSHLEYDFVVQPRGNYGNIQLRFDDADAVTVDASGDLLVTRGAKELHFKKPVIYQGSGSQRSVVKGGFTVSVKDVGFWVSEYDKSQPLIIDPELVYSTLFRGTVRRIATDASGNVVISGETYGEIPLQSPFQSSAQIFPAAFITKFDPTGSQLIYSTYFSGSQSSFVTALAVDASGNAYIAGNSFSPDIPTTTGAFLPQYPGGSSFLAKFDPNGILLFSTYTGGSEKSVRDIALDHSGAVVIAGNNAFGDLPLVNPFQSMVSSGFVQKFDPTGSQLLYSTYFDGSITAMTLDTNGSVYLVGNTIGTIGSIPLKNALQTEGGNFFLSKFNPQGDALVYSTLLGVGGPTGIAVDAQGNVFIAGAVTTLQLPLTANALQTSCFVGPNAGSEHPCSGPQAFVMAVNSAGTALIYSTLLGAGTANAIAVDASGNAYVAGNASSDYFPLLNPIQAGEPTLGAGGAFLTKLDVSGSPKFSTLLFGLRQGSESVLGLALDKSGKVLLGGTTSSPDFPVVAPFQATGGPGFIAKVSLTSNTPTLSVSRFQPWVHVRNVSTVPVNISSISVSSPFAISGTCGASTTLPPASECIAVLSQRGFAADLTITSNASATPQTFSIMPSLDPPAPFPWLYSPAILSFPPQFFGTTSEPQSVTITNLANQPLTVNSIQATSPDFSIADGCTGTIAAFDSCNFAVAFSPKGGTGVGQVALAFSAPFITGTGNPPTVPDLFWVLGQPSTSSLFASVQNLGFGGQYPGVAGLPRLVTLFNSTPAPVSLGTPSVSEPYSISNPCGSVLAAGANCRITVVFAPMGNGFFSGNLQIPFTGVGSPVNVSLSGIGRIFSNLQISPLSIDFGPATIGTAGLGSQLTLTNVGTSSMTISGFTFSDPHFSQTNNCPQNPNTLGPGASCIVDLVFQPTAVGGVSANLNIQHTGVGNPQVVSLVGSGKTALDLQPSLLDFGVQALGTSSQRDVTMGNGTGGPPITIQSVTLTGSDFQLAPNSCPAAGQQLGTFVGCSLPITFAPSVNGVRSGTLTVVASDFSAPHVTTLTGIGGSSSRASLSATSLIFGFQNVGTSGSAQGITLSSTGSVALNISNVTASAGFSLAQNGCASILAPGTNCSLWVVFSPTASGGQSGMLSIISDATNSPQTVALSGNGTDFAAQAAAGGNAVSINAGQTATYNLQLVPTAGFSGVVTLACTGAPLKSSCSVAPSNLIVSGDPVAFNVTVATMASSSGNLASLRTVVVVFGILIPCGIGTVRRKRGALRHLLSGCLFGLLLLLCSCGGGSSGGTPPPAGAQGTPSGTYSLTVKATSGTQARSLSLSLTVR